jgi:hypothetical protein
MNEDLELRLRDAFAATRLPAAPASLSMTLAELALEADPTLATRRRRRAMLVLTIAAVVVASFTGVLVLQTLTPMTTGGPGFTSERPATGSASPSASPSPSASAVDLGGVHVFEVGELQAALAGADRPTGSIGLRGYWTNRIVMHSCVPPREPPGELEIRCSDGEFGITEENEPIVTILRTGEMVPATGPALTPWMPENLQRRLFVLPIVNDQPYTPVPIIVRGHVDDPRAAKCQPEARQICLDRFVIEEIVSFDPSSVPPPTPTPVPSPFPYEDPPPAPLETSRCFGDTEYEFVGWKTMRELGIDLGDPDEVLYVVILKHVIQVGDWTDDPAGSGRRFRTMAQRVCYAHEWERGSIGFTWLPGTAFREWDDGSRTPIEP